MLILMGYYINHKKVYRLMKENYLLMPKKTRIKKNYAKYRTVTPKASLEVLEMDIKYFYVARDGRHAFVLTVIDTFTRVVLAWKVGFTINARQVEHLWQNIIVQYLQPWDLLNKGVHLEIRNDNGPQFSAKSINAFFKQNYINQVFTHPYTPQENGHIESFHAIISKALGNNNFWSLDELEKRLNTFYNSYIDFMLGKGN
ncbi:MAG: transposase, partial [Candidatus Zixiibacteriota bacterium]